MLSRVAEMKQRHVSSAIHLEYWKSLFKMLPTVIVTRCPPAVAGEYRSRPPGVPQWGQFGAF
jgi:hypothetical protein